MSELRAFAPAIRAMSVLLCAGAAIGFVGGCVVVNTQHCGYSANGADNPCPEGYVCSVCAVENNGCVPIDQQDTITKACLGGASGASTMTATDTSDPTDTTLTPPTGTTLTGGDPTGGTDTSGTDTMSTTGTTTETSSTTAPVDCDPGDVNDPKCTHYCLPSGVCGDCTDLPGEGLSCGGLFPDKSVCNDETGACSECSAADASQCSGATPACDGASGTCVKCSEHFQCPAACDIETGMCFPEEERVYYVRGSVVCLGDGSMDSPFCSFNEVPLVAGQPTTIKVLPSDVSLKALDVPDGAVVAVVRAGDQIVNIDGSNNFTPTIQVSGAESRVYVYRLNFRLAFGAIMQCDSGGKLWVHDSQIEGNGTNGVFALDAANCQSRIARSVIRQCGSGIRVSGGDLRVDSSFLLANGRAVADFGAFDIGGVDPKVRISYSSILLNKSTTTTSVFNCKGGPWDVAVRNSAVIGVMPMETMDCATYEGGMKYEALDPADEQTTANNWFTAFPGSLYSPKDTAAEDPLEATADWGDGDPLLDFNRAPIPQDGSTWAGAIQPP